MGRAGSRRILSIRIHLQRIFWQSLSRALKSIRIAGRAVVLGMGFLGAPLRPVGRLVFHTVLVELYKGYLFLKKRLGGVFRMAKNPFLFPFSSRYVLHGVLIIVTLFVSANSLRAREVRQEDLAQPTLLATILTQDGERDIVESALPVPSASDRYRGIGGVSQFDIVETAEAATALALDLEESAAALNSDVGAASNDIAQRESVITHVVAGGETLSTIAQEYRISINTLRWANNITNDLIKPGQELVVLPTTGVLHRVKAGDTVQALANTYKADAEKIIAFNKLGSADTIREGQSLIIPEGSVAPPPLPAPTSRIAQITESTPGVSATPPPNASVRGVSGLLWPAVSRRINQYFRLFGRGYGHTGIDVDGNTGQPVYAAADGVVSVAGWGRGYGIHVIVNHGNGLETLYGHESKLYVKAGQYVKKGQVLGAIGCTGWCTGPHVHFEVRIGGVPRNPLSYL